MMTQASTAGIDMTAVEKPMFIFDVTTDATLTLDDAVYEHKFQIIGTNQYLLVTTDKPGSSFSFPADSVIKQIPIQHISKFLQLFNITGWVDKDIKGQFDNQKLAVVIWDFLPDKDTSTEDFSEKMNNYIQMYKEAEKEVQPASFAVVGRLPFRFYYFVELDDSSIENAIKFGLDAFGGPGNARIRTYHLEKLA